MNIAIITTIKHNVGDDFVREGILYLMRCLVPKQNVSLIHKHIPLTARRNWEWFYSSGISKKLDRLPKPLGHYFSRHIDKLPLSWKNDKVLTCDLLIQSGAPVFYAHGKHSCSRNEWYHPLLIRRWELIKNRTPFLNIAAGSNQSYYPSLEPFKKSIETIKYIQSLVDSATLTTLRDKFSKSILNISGRDADVLPCTSLFARESLGFKISEPEFVALNYMPGGGHYDFDQNIDSVKWERTFVQFANELSQKERCVLVCHNRRELNEAKRLLPNIENFYSDKYTNILEFYKNAKYGIVNRVHAAFGIASYGRPSIVIGTDARAIMAEMIGLKHFYVGNVTKELLKEELHQMKKDTDNYQMILENILTNAKKEYLELIGKALQKTKL